MRKHATCRWRRLLWAHFGPLREDENATTTLEYALLLALIVGVCVVAYQNLGIATSDSVSDSTGELPQPGLIPDPQDPGVAGPDR